MIKRQTRFTAGLPYFGKRKVRDQFDDAPMFSVNEAIHALLLAAVCYVFAVLVMSM